MKKEQNIKFRLNAKSIDTTKYWLDMIKYDLKLNRKDLIEIMEFELKKLENNTQRILNGEDLKRDEKLYCNCGYKHCYVDEMKLYCGECKRLVDVAKIT